jgi:diaminopimelate epimerase
MHANGDDFVVIDMRGAAGAVTSDLARRLGDRHRGIGFNQLAVMLGRADAASKLKNWQLLRPLSFA